MFSRRSQETAADWSRVSHRHIIITYREYAERLARTPDALSSGKKGRPKVAAATAAPLSGLSAAVLAVLFRAHVFSRPSAEHQRRARSSRSWTHHTRRSSRTAARSSARARAKTIAAHAPARDSHSRTVGCRCCGSRSRQHTKYTSVQSRSESTADKFLGKFFSSDPFPSLLTAHRHLNPFRSRFSPSRRGRSLDRLSFAIPDGLSAANDHCHRRRHRQNYDRCHRTKHVSMMILLLLLSYHHSIIIMIIIFLISIIIKTFIMLIVSLGSLDHIILLCYIRIQITCVKDFLYLR